MNAPLIVIVGETASGKSSLAMHLAQQFSGEIICADSWTVRREVSIGTAKPSSADQSLIPHHLLDVVGPEEVFSAAQFKTLANAAIADIAKRGKLPIMVGGTGLYVDSVLYDYGFREPANSEIRDRLSDVNVEVVLEEVHQRGISTDGIDTKNKHRLLRLLETGGATPTKQPLRNNTLILGLQTEREYLRQRVILRTDTMIEQGLEAEVGGLVERYGWGCEALKGVGYAQWKGYFEGTKTLQQTRDDIIKATMNLAKRQRTWFKRNKSIQWLSTPVKSADAVDSVTTFLQAQS